MQIEIVPSATSEPETFIPVRELRTISEAVKLLFSTGFAAEQPSARSSHLYLPRRATSAMELSLNVLFLGDLNKRENVSDWRNRVRPAA